MSAWKLKVPSLSFRSFKYVESDKTKTPILALSLPRKFPSQQARILSNIDYRLDAGSFLINEGSLVGTAIGSLNRNLLRLIRSGINRDPDHLDGMFQIRSIYSLLHVKAALPYP